MYRIDISSLVLVFLTSVNYCWASLGKKNTLNHGTHQQDQLGRISAINNRMNFYSKDCVSTIPYLTQQIGLWFMKAKATIFGFLHDELWPYRLIWSNECNHFTTLPYLGVLYKLEVSLHLRNLKWNDQPQSQFFLNLWSPPWFFVCKIGGRCVPDVSMIVFGNKIHQVLQ